MDDFHLEFGGFAYSVAYSTHSHNLSIYVNHQSGRHEEVKNHSLTQSLVDAFEPHVHHVDVFTGEKYS